MHSINTRRSLPCIVLLAALTVGNRSFADEVVHMVLSIGNSHTIGRAGVSGGDAFNSKVWQWNQAGNLEQPGLVTDYEAQLSHVDPLENRYSPDVTFAEDYLTAHPGIDRLVFVPHAKGGTGFVDPDDPEDQSGNWSADDDKLSSTSVPSRLSEAVARYNTAAAYLSGQGFIVVHAGTLFHNANPDYDPSEIRWGETDEAYSRIWDTHRRQIDDMIAYLRSHLTGYTDTTPVVIGGGMIDHQFSNRPTNDALFQANLNGAHRRLDYVGTYDPINARDDFPTGLPIPHTDAFHASRAGDITKGHLRALALARAAQNSDHLAPFGDLSFFSSLEAFWDFRSGTPLDMSGNDYHLIRYRVDPLANRPPLYRFDPDLDELAWKRTAASTYRIHELPMALPADYTIAVFVKLDQLTEAVAFLQQAGGPVVNQHRFQYSVTYSEVRAGHGADADAVDFSSSLIGTSDYHLITLGYDSATTTMKLGLDGSIQDSNTSVPAHSSKPGSFLGGATAEAANPLVGSMVFAMVANRALTDTEIAELWSAAQAL